MQGETAIDPSTTLSLQHYSTSNSHLPRAGRCSPFEAAAAGDVGSECKFCQKLNLDHMLAEARLASFGFGPKWK